MNIEIIIFKVVAFAVIGGVVCIAAKCWRNVKGVKK